MRDYRSPLLDWPGAVEAEGVDAGVAWHYGDPLGEQRAAADGAVLFDHSHRDVLVVPGPDRLEWLHAITSQHLLALTDGSSTESLVLSPNGHIEQHWVVTELGDRIWIDTEPGAAEEVLGYLLKMRFLKRVEPATVTAGYAVLALRGPRAVDVLATAGLPAWPAGALALPGGAVDSPTGVAEDGAGTGLVRAVPDGFDLIVPRPLLGEVAGRLRDAGARPAGSWAEAALRVVARRPRLGVDTDHRTIPHEVGLIGTAVHLDKGCYRGQETVARVQNLGKPPRRLVMLHLAGESEQLPPPGSPVERDGRAIGFLGTAVQHHEYGPVALAVIKRGVGAQDVLSVAGQTAAIDPDDAEFVAVEGFAGHRA